MSTTNKSGQSELPIPVILERHVKPTFKGVLTTDQCYKSGLGTPMFSLRGQSTIPAKLVFRE